MQETLQPQVMPRHVFMQYHKQLVASRTMAFHQQTLQMMSPEERMDPEAKRQAVIRRVARELWTNFAVRGEDTPMLRHLCERLSEHYGKQLEFHYEPGGFELIILCRTDSGLQAVSDSEKVSLINRAWEISLEVVRSYVV